MRFQQPNSRARAMHQVVNQLTLGNGVTLTFQTASEARYGLEALHEVATARRVGIVVESVGHRTVEVRLAKAKAA